MPGPNPQPLPLDEARKKFPPIWVVYERPLDFPDGWVVRQWWGTTPEPRGYGFATLELARQFVHQQGGSVLLAPIPGDQPHIRETWL